MRRLFKPAARSLHFASVLRGRLTTHHRLGHTRSLFAITYCMHVLLDSCVFHRPPSGRCPWGRMRKSTRATGVPVRRHPHRLIQALNWLSSHTHARPPSLYASIHHHISPHDDAFIKAFSLARHFLARRPHGSFAAAKLWQGANMIVCIVFILIIVIWVFPSCSWLNKLISRLCRSCCTRPPFARSDGAGSSQRG